MDDKKATNINQMYNDLMSNLTGGGGSVSSSSEGLEELDSFQKSLQESTQSETYQMPVKGGRDERTEAIMRSLHSGEHTKDNWIIGTYVKDDIKINPLHPKGHKGIDVAVHPDDDGKIPAHPIASGIVKEVSYSPRSGNFCSILHEDGRVKSFYSHMHSVSVSEGQEVDQSTVIGRVGRTGNAKSGAPHVHLEVFVDGKNINPMKIMGQPVGSLSKKASVIKDTVRFLNKYAKSRKDILEEIIKAN